MRSLQNSAEIFRDHAGLSRCTQAHIIALTYVNATNASHEGRGMAVTCRSPSEALTKVLRLQSALKRHR